MTEQLQLRVDPATAASELRLTALASTRLNIDANRIKGIRIIKRSIDARQRNVMINLTLLAYVDEDPSATLFAPEPYDRLPKSAPAAVVVGAGPAGLFAALRLIQLGIKPIVIERGKDVDSRRIDMARLSREGVVDPDSNYCFGEGGAGAYSDGKLYTRSKKRGDTDRILRIFCQHGAQTDILADAHPHIGTDRLPEVIKAMRHTIERCGGEVRFSTRAEQIITDESGHATGVSTDRGDLRGKVILATGHSARDVYRTLRASGIGMEAKGIAIGVRLEHPQALIDRIRYHSKEGRGKYLPAAEYTMLTRVENRGVYSFCMCPGGFIIPASSEPGLLVVNGMSPSNRGTRWANSGMVVELLPEDVATPEGEDETLRMMLYQEEIERRFFNAGDGTQKAPAQRMTDFVAGRDSDTLPPSSYAPGLYPARVDKLLPDCISRRLRKGFEEMGRKNRGFLTQEATVIGDETRTSAPVRLVRDPSTLQSLTTPGLFPCGEGAGYAGGIVSAAIDGERCAEALAASLQSN
ncbi:NAD(P)/FAD-dependent oxidoreductase [Paramuribaculum intestinale]|uniref:NAD(P)/FAD-dependent oxidoreductase n=1 Tax=Paramuribaculum intestinale TaxID=2094151 RepID=UPI0025B1D7BA|nr:NAD(P)/FAD-dependent oxidoreductase [Paramuribaculum intestinale]